MSDKNEVTELSIKVSVDTTELDKLEAQLKRIAGLLVDAGIKVSNHVGFSAQQFVFGQECILAKDCFINDVVLKNAIEIHQLQKEPEEDERLKDAATKIGMESLLKTLQRLADDTQNNQKQMEELTRVFNDTNATIAEQIRRISIDALRNNSGFA